MHLQTRGFEPAFGQELVVGQDIIRRYWAKRGLDVALHVGQQADDDTAGDLLGIAIVQILQIAEITFNFGRQKGLVLSPTINMTDIMVISIIVITVSVIASLQPAFKASRMEPVDALRHV